MPDPTDRNGNQGETGPDGAPQRSGAPSLARLLRPLQHPMRRIAVAACLLLLLLLALVTGALPPFQRSARSLASPTAPARPSETPTQPTVTPGPEVWASLEQRPFHLPTLAPGAACPLIPARHISPQYGLALGAGPMYAVGFDPDGTLSAANAAQFGAGTSAWGGANLLWVITSGNSGPVVIRGRQIDGPNGLRFNGGLDQDYEDWNAAPLLPELRLLWSDQAGSWGSYVRLQAPGCYAMQIDGVSFSEVIVFQAVMDA